MDIVWDPPGVGEWALDRSHMPGGCTPIVQELARRTAIAGTRRMLRELGSPIDAIQMEFVHGWVYTRVRPLIRPEANSTRLPPLPVLKLTLRLHPEMRRRARTAERVQREEPWNQVIHDWHHGGRAAIVARNLELQRVPVDTCPDDELMAHVRECWQHCLENWERHFWLHGYDMGPLGQYLWEAREWGIEADDLLSLLEGASPSTTNPARQAAAIRAAVDATGASPNTLADLRAVSPAVAAMVDDYLHTRGWVLFSRYDIDGVTLGERPDLVLATIMNAEHRETSAEVAARTALIREQVPEPHRDRFDEVLRQARAAMDLRDDNGPTTAEWPAGLLRRALLAVGDRMVRSGSIDDRTLALELLPSELECRVPSELPDASTLRARSELRALQRRLDPPAVLGRAGPMPPLDVFPPSLARGVGMVQTVMQHMGMDGAVGGDGLHGSGIGTIAVRATACVASSPEEALDRLQPGQVLVVAATTPAYNLVLSMAGAVVTADGGPMSHAAVIARELGISAVVGARAALVDIPDGALVEVDPVAGTVRLV